MRVLALAELDPAMGELVIWCEGRCSSEVQKTLATHLGGIGGQDDRDDAPDKGQSLLQTPILQSSNRQRGHLEAAVASLAPTSKRHFVELQSAALAECFFLQRS